VGGLLRLYDRLLEHALSSAADGSRPADRPWVQATLAELDADLSVARLFGYRTASLIDAGATLSAEASIQKVFSSELRTRLAEAAFEIIGPEALEAAESPGAPLGGLAEEVYRAAPMFRFGGGTSEVMRDLIARRGLGLPRA